MRALPVAYATVFCIASLLVSPVLVLAQQSGSNSSAGMEKAATMAPSQRDGVVIFGVDRNFRPFEWVTQSGDARGFIVDLEKALAGHGEKRPVYVTAAWPELVTALDEGTIDILPMFITPDRQTRYSFTRPFFFFKHAIYARPGLRGLTTLDDLSGARIAVEGRSFAEERLMAQHPDIEVLRVDGTLDTLQAVIGGDADAAVIAAPVANDLIRTHSLPIERYGTPFWSEGYAFAVRKDRQALVGWMIQSFSHLLMSGDYDVIFDQWQSDLEPVSMGNGRWLRRVAPYIALGAGLALFAAAAFFWWYYRIGRGSGRFGAGLGPVTETLVAYHDTRTGVPGTDLFARQVEAILREEGTDSDGNRWKYAVFALSDFESAVRMHGVQGVAGLIKMVADRLREQEYRAVGYFGRGYFGVLSERQILRLGPHTLLDPVEVPFTDVVSDVICGIVKVPQGAERLEDFAHFAETALSQCPVRHRKWLFYDSSMEPDPLDTRIVRVFRHNDMDGLSVVYQPQIDVVTGAVVGLEALIRWQHPTLGFVPPGKFIPLLEQAGLVGKVTDFVLNHATALAARLFREGYSVYVSVNLSVYDLMGLEVYDHIATCLERYGCPASQLVIELTETAFATDPEMVRATLARLRTLGVKISIDDFGTGYASLSYLSEFPADEVKIDRLFVSRMRKSERDRAIIRSTIKLAHEIGLLVVAEGVEDQHTLAMLRVENCDRVQGYGISRPLDEAKVQAYLERHNIELGLAER